MITDHAVPGHPNLSAYRVRHLQAKAWLTRRLSRIIHLAPLFPTALQTRPKKHLLTLRLSRRLFRASVVPTTSSHSMTSSTSRLATAKPIHFLHLQMTKPLPLKMYLGMLAALVVKGQA